MSHFDVNNSIHKI